MGNGLGKPSSKEIIKQEEQEVHSSKQNLRAAYPKDKLEIKRFFFFEPYITDRFEAHVTVKLSFFHRCLHTAVLLAPLRYGKIFWCQRCQTS